MIRSPRQVDRLPGVRAAVAGLCLLAVTAGASAASLGALETSSILAFTQVANQLTVSFTGAGTGSVSANPPGGSCTSLCTLPYSPGRVVELTATAQTGSFESWVGCDSTSGTGGSICSVTMTSNRGVTVTFTDP